MNIYIDLSMAIDTLVHEILTIVLLLILRKAKKNSFNIFNENDVEMFGISWTKFCSISSLVHRNWLIIA